MDEELLTVEEIADRLKVHIESVRRWLRDGKLKGYRINRRVGWRVPVSELDRFVRGEVAGNDASRRDKPSG